MSKVLFFGIPAYGHTNPTLPLVAELVGRGEQVIYYSSEAFQPAIEQTGATFRSIGTFFNEQTYVDENLVRFWYILIQATQEIIPAILADVTADKPDYVIFDSLCVWGKCLAQNSKSASDCVYNDACSSCVNDASRGACWCARVSAHDGASIIRGSQRDCKVSCDY